MKQSLLLVYCLIIIGLWGCAYFPFQKEPEPPPLPSIDVVEETKPPLTVKAQYFNEFPWAELGKTKKDENFPNIKMYTWKDSDTWENVAEKEMGNKAQGKKLAEFNDSKDKVPPTGEKVAIPNPIIGIKSELQVKRKGEKQFGQPQPIDTSLTKGDEYRFRFDSNVDGYLYVFRETPKGVELLYPAKVRTGRRNRTAAPLSRDSGKILAGAPVLIPSSETKGYPYDPKQKSDQIYAFLTINKDPIQALDDLKEKTKIKRADLDEVMQSVGDQVKKDGPIQVLRISDPKEILGVILNISG
jgi:hypothetical protein